MSDDNTPTEEEATRVLDEILPMRGENVRARQHAVLLTWLRVMHDRGRSLGHKEGWNEARMGGDL